MKKLNKILKKQKIILNELEKQRLKKKNLRRKPKKVAVRGKEKCKRKKK